MKAGRRREIVPAPTAAQVRDALGGVVEREGGGPPDWADTMSRFLAKLLEWNASVNLISRRTAGEALARHVLPSLAALPLVPPGKEIRLLDVGAGGGFPGIPLRILRPQVRLDLVEATRNKCRFLEDCLGHLGWTESTVHWCRIERPDERLVARAPFDLALARAVGDDILLSGAAEPLLRAGGGGGLWVFAPPGAGEQRFESSTGEPITSLRRVR